MSKYKITNKNKEHSYKHAIQYIATLIKPHRKWYFIASVLAFISAAVGILNAKATQGLVDGAKAGQQRDIILNAVLLALIIAANYIITRISGVSVAKLAANASRDMKCNVASALLDAITKKSLFCRPGTLFRPSTPTAKTSRTFWAVI